MVSPLITRGFGFAAKFVITAGLSLPLVVPPATPPVLPDPAGTVNQLEVLVNSIVRDVYIGSLNVTQNSGGQNSTASFSIDTTQAAWDIAVGNYVTVRFATGTPVVFTGVIQKIGYQLLGGGKIRYTCHCISYNIKLDSVIIGPVTFAAGTTDQAALRSLFTSYAPTIYTTGSTSDVQEVAVLDDGATFENISLREALQRIAEQTGAEWYIDVTPALHYYSPALNPAPFSLTDSGYDRVTSFPYHRNPTYEQDASILCNKLRVLGAWTEDTGTASGVAQNAVSQAVYGIREKLIADRSLTTSGQCQAYADAYVEAYSQPLESGTIVYRHGSVDVASVSSAVVLRTLSVGQYLSITCETHGISKSYVVRTLVIKQLNRDTTEFTATFGSQRPNLKRTLQSTIRNSQNTQTNVTNNPPAVNSGYFTARCILPTIDGAAEDVLAHPFVFDRNVTLSRWSIECKRDNPPSSEILIDVLVFSQTVPGTDSYSAVSAVVAGGGTGYTNGDTISLVGGTGTVTAQFTATVTDGAITAVALLVAGEYSIKPDNPVSVSGGTGSGATLTVTWRDNSWVSIVNEGSLGEYINLPVISGEDNFRNTGYTFTQTAFVIGNRLRVDIISGTATQIEFTLTGSYA